MLEKNFNNFLLSFMERVWVGQWYSAHVIILNHKRSFKKSGISDYFALSLASSDVVIMLLLTSVSTATLAISTIAKG